MARRIVLAVLALIAAILGTVALPLGLITAAEDRHVFHNETVSTSTSLANLAEERLDDGTGGKALHRFVAQLGTTHHRVSVFDRAGVKIAGTAPPPALGAGWLTRARTATEPVIYPVNGAIVVVTPVRNDAGTSNVGTVALSRPTSSVDHEIAVLWGLIGAVGAAGLVAAALVAVGLARWVSRPLSKLEGAAQLLGEGDLETRSPADAGPSEVRRLASNFNVMAARLESLVHGHQATMADVSHQLRTPLAALRLRLDLLAQDSDEAVAAELADAQEEIARLSRLVDGLLAVARAESSTAAPTVVRADTVIESRVAAWRPAAEEQGVTLRAASDGRVRTRIGDGQLEQILDNLLANALDAVRAGASIMITAKATPDSAVIIVADTGPGMSAQQKRHAFRRFATSSQGGTGLGLAIVDRLVVSNGGAATLSDTPGGGLTVTIELPAATEGGRPRRIAGSRRVTQMHHTQD